MAFVYLVADIFSGFPSSDPQPIVSYNGELFFAATNPASGGRELWKSDGTASGTVKVKDIYPGVTSSDPSLMAVAGSTLYFTADNGLSGRELWKSDGTASGTALVADINQAPDPLISGATLSSNPNSLTAVGSTLFFFASVDIGGGLTRQMLFKSDGTASGTVLVKDIQPATGSGTFTAVLGNELFFIGLDPVYGAELWKSDGTTGGTTILIDLIPGYNSSPGISNLTVVGNRLYFNGGGVSYTDGITVTTVPLPASPPPGEAPLAAGGSDLTAVGNTLFFVGRDTLGFNWLCSTDGNSISQVKKLTSSPGGSGGGSWGSLTGVGNTLFFAFNDGVNGTELWKTDGTSSGTVLVKDVNPGATSSNLTRFKSIGNMLYFVADDGVHGQELWQSDGTAAGTTLVADINPGSLTSTPRFITAVGSSVFFTADNGSQGTELYVISPTAPPPPTPGFVLASDTGSSPTDGITKNPTVNVSGIVTGNTWEYSTDGGTNWTPGVGSGSGTSFTLPEGQYTIGLIQVRQNNGSQNSAATSNTSAITVDLTAPAQPGPSLASDTGALANDGVTNVGTVSVSGLEAGATWEFSLNGGVNWSAGSGSTFTLAPGTYATGAVQVRQTDLAGNLGPTGSTTGAITVDTTAPVAPTPILVADTGSSSTDRITANGAFTVSGLEGTASWEYSSDGGSNWSSGSGSGFTLAAGTYAPNAIQVRQTDLAGNPSSTVSYGSTLVVDTSAAAPSLTLAVDTGISNSDGISSNGLANVSGLESGATWRFSTNGGSTWTNGSGSSFTLAPSIYAANAIQVQQTDLAGNVSPLGTNAAPIRIDATAPTITQRLVGGSDGQSVILRFSEPVAFPGATAARFVVKQGKSTIAVTGVSSTPGDTSVTLTLASSISTASLYSVSYTDLSSANNTTGVIEDLADNDLATSAATTINAYLAAASVDMVTGFNSGYTRVELMPTAGTASLRGNAAANTLVGNDSANLLAGRAGLDVLTGLGGSDTFDYSILNDGLMGGSRNARTFERITDLTVGSVNDGGDVIKLPLIPTDPCKVLGAVTALSDSAIGALLNGSTGGTANFAARGAATFTFGSGASLRTFLALNDGTAGFSPRTDAIVEITGYAFAPGSETLSSLLFSG